MKKITATIIKEWQLMKRDISGMLLLFVMPAVLIIVMALVQDAPFRDYKEMKLDLLLSDNDNGSLARQIITGLKQNKSFNVIDSIDSQRMTDNKLKDLLNKGAYTIGIIIPEGVTAEVVNSANLLANNIAKRTGLEANLPAREVREQVYIRLYFDPVSKPAFRSAINSVLEKYIAWSGSGILMQRLSILGKNAGSENDTTGQEDMRKIIQGIAVKEEPLNNEGKYIVHMSSVQHNVPAWAIFGMFFIVIPIAGHILKEREDGSELRISLIPRSASHVAIGKIIFYTLICTLQFGLMLSIGLWVMPLFHLPALYLGAHPLILLPVAICISFAATAFGFFAGTIFRTFTQALPFSAISIVILSAIGGIWVPIYILPHTMQIMALASPLHWALEAVNNIILRDGNFVSVALPLTVLIATGLALWLIGILVHRKRTH